MSDPPTAIVTTPPRQMSPDDHAALDLAVRRMFRSRGVVVRVADLLGGMFGSVAAAGWRNLRVSRRVTSQLKGVAEAALRRAFDLAIVARDRTQWATSPGTARALAIGSGAVAGFAGLSGFLPDATATTLLIMRNIAAIAEQEGEDLDDPDARQACLEVLGFGATGIGESPEDADTAYWSARLVMHGRPMSLLLSEVAATYGMRLSQRLASTIIPVVGAASGALVNSTFLDHYRNVARVHFTIRRLEREYGTVEIRQQASLIAANLRAGHHTPVAA